jgi:hypothetical protein
MIVRYGIIVVAVFQARMFIFVVHIVVIIISHVRQTRVDIQVLFLAHWIVIIVVTYARHGLIGLESTLLHAGFVKQAMYALETVRFSILLISFVLLFISQIDFQTGFSILIEFIGNAQTAQVRRVRTAYCVVGGLQIPFHLVDVEIVEGFVVLRLLTGLAQCCRIFDLIKSKKS